jgi:hypothetical protein
MMMEAICGSETSVLTRAMLSHPEDGMLDISMFGFKSILNKCVEE